MDSESRASLVEVARLLIAAGVDVDAKDRQGRTAAEIAAAKGRTEIVELIKRGK